MTKRFAFALLLFVGLQPAVEATPVRATATARVGARIVAAPRTVTTPALPDTIAITREDAERGYTVVPVVPSPRGLAIASGDREAGPRPAREEKGSLAIRVGEGAETIELVWHGE